MDLNDYRITGQFLYADFSKCIVGILDAALLSADIRGSVQQIQGRGKAPDSLARKLVLRDLFESDSIETEIKDLAGCRLVFYHNDDLNLFINSGLISDNFDVDWNNSSFHYPEPEIASVNDYYTVNHYVVSLKPERAALPDFERFSGMRCEVQIQTLLNHAWSETVHDITYKNPLPTGFGETQMHSIEERLKGIMTDLLRKAGYEFQKVKHDFSRLLAGKAIFDQDILALVEGAQDMNALYELMERYKDYVLPNLSNVESHADQIYRVVEQAITRAEFIGTDDIRTPIGPFRGKGHAEVLNICLDILSFVRYLDFERTHQLLMTIQRNHVREDELVDFADRVDDIAAYRVNALRKFGYGVQSRLIAAIEILPDPDLLAPSTYVLAVCRALLNPVLSKATWVYDHVELSRSNLPGSPELAAIREGALRALSRIAASDDTAIRQSAIECMKRAADRPSLGPYDDALLEIVLKNTSDVIYTMIEHLPNSDLQTVQTDEVWVHRQYQLTRSILNGGPDTEPLLVAAENVVANAVSYRDAANRRLNYSRYKTLIGFRSVFDADWDAPRRSAQDTRAHRDNEISSYIEEINEHNFQEWVALFAECMKADRSDAATAHHFQDFLRGFAQSKPDLANRALATEKARLAPLLHHILLGLNDAGRYDLFDSIIDRCVSTGGYLTQCAQPFAQSALEHREPLHRILKAAMEQ